MDWKFKEGISVRLDDFYYDIAHGGYIEPSEVLSCPEQAKAVNDAVALLVSFESAYEQLADEE